MRSVILILLISIAFSILSFIRHASEQSRDVFAQDSDVIALLPAGLAAEDLRPMSGKIKDDQGGGPNPSTIRCEVIIGPILGLVTDSTIRILLEVSSNSTVSMDVMSSPTSLRPRHISTSSFPSASSSPEASTLHSSSHTSTVTESLHAYRPHSFFFTGLQPDTDYTVHINQDDCLLSSRQVHGKFRTIPSGWKLDQLSPREGMRQAAKREYVAARFGIVSCNNVNETFRRARDVDYQNNATGDLWEVLGDLTEKGELDFLFHLGDQVYLDKARISGPTPAERLLLTKAGREAPEKWALYAEEIQEIYRKLYRQSWGRPAVARVLSTVPNLMMYDDHEVRDDHGLPQCPEDRDPGSMEYFIHLQARQVLYEYEFQLHADMPALLKEGSQWKPDDTPGLEESSEYCDQEGSGHVRCKQAASAWAGDHHMHSLGGFGFCFLDVHGGKSWWRHLNPPEDPLPFLGSRQWAELAEALSPGGLFDNSRVLLVLSPVPPVMASPALLRALAGFQDDLYGHFATQPGELNRFLDLLWRWRSARPVGERTVLLVGGDVHIGGHTTLYPPSLAAHRFAQQTARHSELQQPLEQFVVSAVAQKVAKWHEMAALTLLPMLMSDDILRGNFDGYGESTERPWFQPSTLPGPRRLESLYFHLSVMENDTTSASACVVNPNCAQTPKTLWSFRHHGWTRHNNIGLVEVSLSPPAVDLDRGCPGPVETVLSSSDSSQPLPPACAPPTPSSSAHSLPQVSISKWLVETRHLEPWARYLKPH